MIYVHIAFGLVGEDFGGGKSHNIFNFSSSARDMALFISFAIDGAMLFSRAYKPNHFQIVTELILDMLGDN